MENRLEIFIKSHEFDEVVLVNSDGDTFTFDPQKFEELLDFLTPRESISFSGVTENRDTVENLVLDYNVIKILTDNGYYANGKLDESTGCAPISSALKLAREDLKNDENQVLLNFLRKRIQP